MGEGAPRVGAAERGAGFGRNGVRDLDARFERRLDHWLSYYRIAIGGFAFVLLLVLVPGMSWVKVLCALYLMAAFSVLPLLRRFGFHERAKFWIRTAILLIDVLTVSIAGFGWGGRTSPALFMYVPIVVGWALLPETGLGRAALVLCLIGLTVLFWFRPSAPFGLDALLPVTTLVGGWMLFGVITSALVAVHKLLSYTMIQLRQHADLLSALMTEKQTREREAEWAARLEEAGRLEALGRLAGGVAHDFNNLLTALIGSAELVDLRLTKNPEAARSALRDLQAAAERGSGLTAQLLDFARRRPAEPKDVDLRRSVEETGHLLQRLLRDNITLRLEPGPEPCGVRLDASSLERLLLNLCVNAADAMPEGGTLTIRVRCDDGGRVLLEVADTGTGIAPEDLPHIFEPFFTRKARGKGTGLGLASVYGIVKQSQGEIEAHSELGGGTQFRIRWPRVPLASMASEPPARRSRARAGTIVLVDDDASVRAVCQEHLRSAGYHVIALSSAREALTTLAELESGPDLLITDVSMPGMTGIELLRVLRERGWNLPVLLISGYSDQLERREEREHLDAAFLPKPFSAERLLAAVSALLDHAAPAPSGHSDGGLRGAPPG